MDKTSGNKEQMCKNAMKEEEVVLVNLIISVLDLFLTREIEVIIRSRECFKKRCFLLWRFGRIKIYTNNEIERKGGATYDMEKKML